MTIDYIQLSPTGNITVLVTTPVPRERQAAVAATLLGPGGVGGEQVGYVEAASDGVSAARLQMMGGEFCGNATMSLGAVLARRRGLPPGQTLALDIEVSGSDAPVPCAIEGREDGWLGTVDMPLPTGIGEIALDTDGGQVVAPLVRMPGIAHLILPARAGLGEAQLRRRLPRWNQEIGAEALGAIQWDEAAASIDPLVYVPSAGTLVREHGCGSGTAAVGSWLALNAGRSLRVPVRQPGGTITAQVKLEGGAIRSLAITGLVRLVSEGTISLP